MARSLGANTVQKRTSIWGLAGVAAVLMVSSAPAETVCPASRESGVWINTDAEIKALSSIEVKTTCAGGGQGWTVRARTRCARSACTWGYARGVRRDDGTLAALFSTFSADRLVRMRVNHDVMEVAVIHVYRTPGRQRTVDTYRLNRNYD